MRCFATPWDDPQAVGDGSVAEPAVEPEGTRHAACEPTMKGRPDPGFDFVLRGRRYIIGYNTERKRWGIHREKTFTALLCWPLIIGIGKHKEA